MILTVVIFILILSLLVLVHEFGHFFVAKLFNIKVEEFGFGLPPKLIGFKKGETTYSINWLPIGGFVKLYGEDEAGTGKPSLKKKEIKDIDRAFFAKPGWQRALVVIAGVIMNFALAVVIISILFSAIGVPTQGDKVIISEVVKDSPADRVGIEKGDVIKSINGKEIKEGQDLINTTRGKLGEEVSLVLDSNGETKNVKIVPRKIYPKTEGPMGVVISQEIVNKKYPWYEAPIVGTRETLKQTGFIISGLFSMFYQLIWQGNVPQGVAGPVGIAQLTGQFVQLGTSAILSFIALLSLNLAILNILPFPALDGGRLLFIVVEMVTGKKINRNFERYAHAIGMAILLALIALVTLNDILRAISGQPILPKP